MVTQAANDEAIAFVSSRQNETEGRHCFGSCVRGYTPASEDSRHELEEDLKAAFHSIPHCEVSVTTVNSHTILYIRVPADSMSRQKLTGCCRRLGNLLVRKGVAVKAEHAEYNPPPPPGKGHLWVVK